MAVTRTMNLPAGTGPVDRTNGSLFFVGTATCVIRCAGFTILTDPNFLHKGGHVHLGYGLTSHRITDPAIEIDALPPIDLVVLSHMHEDHFDRVAEAGLDKAVPIVTTGHAAAKLRRKGFRQVEELDTWEALDVTKGDSQLRITSMPGKHGPGLLNYALPEMMGSMLEFGTPTGDLLYRVYITGDTLIHDALNEIPRRYPDIDLCLLHLGGTRILGFMLTMDADQGVQMLRIVMPQTAVPVHYNDYPVFKSPLDDFVKAASQADLTTVLQYVSHGDTYTFPLRSKEEQRLDRAS